MRDEWVEVDAPATEPVVDTVAHVNQIDRLRLGGDGQLGPPSELTR